MKLFAFDLDGTLLSSKQKISNSTKEGLKLIKNRGDLPIFVTGRHPLTVEKYIKEVDIDWFIGLNGGLIYNFKEKKLYHETFMNFEDAKALAYYAKKTNIGFSLYTPNEIIVFNINHVSQEMKKFINYAYKSINHKILHQWESFSEEEWENYFKKTYKIIMMTLSKNVDNLHHHLKNSFKDNLNIYLGGLGTIECNPSIVNKWNGIKKFKASNPQIKKIIAFGDGHNDHEMIQNSDFGIAMGQGVDPLKKIANFITNTNDDDGILKGIKKIYNIEVE